MTDVGHNFVTPDQLRVGLYVELDLGWMAHPFPKGSFKISSERQIETIRGLGLARVRFDAARSDPLPEDAAPAAIEPAGGVGESAPEAALQAVPAAEPSPEQLRRQQHAAALDAQRESLARCDRQFGAAIHSYQTIESQLASDPAAAASSCQTLVNGFVGEVLGQGESSIRLLSEGMGDRASMHPVNVTVLSLLLGKALGLSSADLHDLGTAAFLHDAGKAQLAERLRWIDAGAPPNDQKLYQDHVAYGVMIAKRMGLSGGALRAIAQHHELMDGSGFPRQTRAEAISQLGKILALVNCYENMCNPFRPAAAVTPHEALSQIFSQMKTRFDTATLGAFIRMMGVYPPGSVVELADQRYGLVVSVNSSRPLKPRVLVHDPAIPVEQALIVDLEQANAPGIRRSLKPAALPRAAIDYLSPRQRICYFFERSVDPPRAEASA